MSPNVTTAVSRTATFRPRSRRSFGRASHRARSPFSHWSICFATQAILPSLARAYGVSPAAMGFAVNASAMGMAISSLVVAFLSDRIDRRLGIALSLALLTIPTSLLAVAPDLMIFTGLRIAQGLCMAAAFTLTLAYLGEHCTGPDAAAAFAAYITGNVASNFLGRLMSAALADHFGLATNFFVFAGLNLCGAMVVFLALEKAPSTAGAGSRTGAMLARPRRASPQPSASGRFRDRILHPLRLHRRLHLREFRSRPAADRHRHDGGRVRLFRLSAVHADDAGGRSLRRSLRGPDDRLGRFDRRPDRPANADCAEPRGGRSRIDAGGVSERSLPRRSRPASSDMRRAVNRGAASGLYLASYFAGGLVGSAVLGQVFDRFGWPACVLGIGMALAVAALLATQLKFARLPSAIPLRQPSGS